MKQHQSNYHPCISYGCLEMLLGAYVNVQVHSVDMHEMMNIRLKHYRKWLRPIKEWCSDMLIFIFSYYGPIPQYFCKYFKCLEL